MLKGRCGIDKQRNTKGGSNDVDYSICPYCMKKMHLITGPPREVKCMYCEKKYYIG